MCGRYTLDKARKDLAAYYGAESKEEEEIESSFNVAPTSAMPVIGNFTRSGRTMQKFRWGLLPTWAEEKITKYSMINARAETVDSKKSYKQHFRQHRCLVPASGFYEWRRESDGTKTPFYIYPEHEELFSFAGLYNVWKSPDGKETIPTYLIITCEANSKMQQVHNRMPVMLLKEEWSEWLDPILDDVAMLKGILNPFPEDALGLYRVSREVNNARNNSLDLIRRAS